MDPNVLLPLLLGLAVLAPLVSFAAIFLGGPKMGKHGQAAGLVATGAIITSFVLSIVSLGIWASNHWPGGGEEHLSVSTVEADHTDEDVGGDEDHNVADGDGHEQDHADDHESQAPPQYYAGDLYVLGQFGNMKLTIGWYIDALGICMFCMVTLIASCIHIYAIGYMHEELHDVTDAEVTLADGSKLTRSGRFPRFFQFLSLFCFSMLGLVYAGNVAMTFVFWELVGICSYFLIGFYVERKSASTAANKAFIVNRIGDFGMIIGLMALWASLGTLSYGDIEKKEVAHSEAEETVEGAPENNIELGLFSLVRSEENDYRLEVPEGMVLAAASEEIEKLAREMPAGASREDFNEAVHAHVPAWREGTEANPRKYGYGLLIVAGIGIFCGCVGKSAQFPLHTWLPDAMEGPTPVSALVHSATMVAAGVFLVARFYPVFAPEVLLVIAVVGGITLFMAATIAITAVDIKRVLAYSTISQLGYMMLALGVGGWLAGVLHLFTHAFFKSLLFMCSGSVIHGVHTNDMTEMGGLRKKMPWTAYTMLIGCLAISGAGIPFLIGFSGYYSKDAILEQAYSFGTVNGGVGNLFFFVAAGGAAITAFYMFRLWFMTFAGTPRNKDRYDHAHESPVIMYGPLVLLSVFAIGVAWQPFDFNLTNLLEQARPAGTLDTETSAMVGMTWPNEHDSHAKDIRTIATLVAFFTALSGFLMAWFFYGAKKINPADVRNQFRWVYQFLWNKWYFDELYDKLFVKPTMFVAGRVSDVDRRWIDRLVDGMANMVRRFAEVFEFIADQTIVDGSVNLFASWTHSLGITLRKLQTGKLRQYVLFIVIGTLALFMLVSMFWGSAAAI